MVSNALYGAIVRLSDHVPSATRAVHAVLRRLPEATYAERSDEVFASPRRVRFVEMEQSVPHEAFSEAFARVRRVYADLGARPHWGKLHARTAADPASAYPRWDAFQDARRRFDPTGTFANEHLDRVLGPVHAPVRP